MIPGGGGAALPPFPLPSLASGILGASFLPGGAALPPLAGFSGGGASAGASTGSAGGFRMTLDPPTSAGGKLGYSPVSGSRPSKYHLLICSSSSRCPVSNCNVHIEHGQNASTRLGQLFSQHGWCVFCPLPMTCFCTSIVLRRWPEALMNRVHVASACLDIAHSSALHCKILWYLQVCFAGAYAEASEFMMPALIVRLD